MRPARNACLIRVNPSHNINKGKNTGTIPTDSSTASDQQQGHRFYPVTSLTQDAHAVKQSPRPHSYSLCSPLILLRSQPCWQSNKYFISNSPEPSVSCSESQLRLYQSQRRGKRAFQPDCSNPRPPALPEKRVFEWDRSIKFSELQGLTAVMSSTPNLQACTQL